ncbi:hypothetical protein B0H10DRAFT_2082460, partial [Mycena sp. CBHHK59/15]
PIWARKHTHTVSVRRVSSRGCLAFDVFLEVENRPSQRREGTAEKAEGRW